MEPGLRTLAGTQGTRRQAAAGGPLIWLGGVLALYLALPFVALLVTYALHPAAPALPLGRPLVISLLTAVAATLLDGLFGVPLGYILARRRGPVRDLLGILVQLPLAVPPLVAGLLLLLVWGPYAPLGRVLPVADTAAGIIAAQAFVAAPFAVVAARSAFAASGAELEDVAGTLGLGPVAAFIRVALPAAWPGIRAGLALTYIRAFGEFGATLVLAYHPYGLPVATWVSFASTGLPAALPAAGLATLAGAGGLWLLERAGARRRSAKVPAVPGGPAAVPRVAAAKPLGLRLTGVRVRLDAFDLLLDAAATGARLAILGPSGAGKSVTLRILAGLTAPEAGEVAAAGERWSGPAVWVPSERRRVGYVPQSGAVFPHLDVARNIGFGLPPLPSAQRVQRVAEWLERLGLQPVAHRLPDTLSGGERQRTALGRALAADPRLLLLDEPFSALDAPLRRQLQQQLLAATDLPWVLVTHDPVEAGLLADEVWVLVGGRVVQAGALTAVRRHPASPEVARVVGIPNVYRAGAGPWPDPPGCLPDGGWCVPPEAVQLLAPGTATPAGALVVPARLRLAVPAPGGYECTAVPERSGPPVVVAAGPRPAVAPAAGTPCLLALDPADAHVWGPSR